MDCGLWPVLSDVQGDGLTVWQTVATLPSPALQDGRELEARPGVTDHHPAGVGQEPQRTLQLALGSLDGAFEHAVGEGVVLVVEQVALVTEVAVPSLGCEAPDIVGAHHRAGDREEMFEARLDAQTVLAQQGKLSLLAHEDLEGVVVVTNTAVTDEVRVEVQCDPHTALKACSSSCVLNPARIRRIIAG